MKVSFLVVLYGRKPSDSTTIKTLINNQDILREAEIVVWNNGPTPLPLSEYRLMTEAGLHVSVAETVSNIPLSWLYNKYIERCDSDYFVILDHDSVLTPHYLSDVMSANHPGVAVPAVSCNGKMHSPKAKPAGKGKSVFSLGPFSKQDRVRAVGSGVVISRAMAQALIARFGTVFDPAFAFYGVDTSLFVRLHTLGQTDAIRVIGGIEHSLSDFEQESPQVKRFRYSEQSKDLGLRLRHYPKRHRTISLLWSLLRARLGLTRMDARELWKAYRNGHHDRCNASNQAAVDAVVIQPL